MEEDRHTVENLMILLAEMTGWGDQCLSVNFGYKQQRYHVAQDEMEYGKEWGFVVNTTICGDSEKSRIDAEGPTLEEALYRLAKKIESSSASRKDWWSGTNSRIREVLQNFDRWNAGELEESPFKHQPPLKPSSKEDFEAGFRAGLREKS